MSSELITIGCKLPHGLKIEVGIEHIPGVWGSVARGPNYASAVINGWYVEHQKTAPTIQPIATLDPEPGLAANFPQGFMACLVRGYGEASPRAKKWPAVRRAG